MQHGQSGSHQKTQRARVALLQKAAGCHHAQVGIPEQAWAGIESVCVCVEGRGVEIKVGEGGGRGSEGTFSLNTRCYAKLRTH